MSSLLNLVDRKATKKYNNVVQLKTKNRPSFILAIFNDIVNLKNATLELKSFHISLRSISIGKPKLSELEKVVLPKGKLYAFFSLERNRDKSEASYQAIIQKYQGMVLDNKIVLN